MNGNWIGHRECHIQSDWLLVYRYEDDVLVLTLARTGTHSDLFNLLLGYCKINLVILREQNFQNYAEE